MQRSALHFLFLFLTAVSFGQDMLVKRDSSKIEAKLLEIEPTELKYKYFNYQDGPTLIVNKDEIAYVLYANGQSERFVITPIAVEKTNPKITCININKIKKDSIRKSLKLSDYITINFDAGLVINENYANKPYANSIRLGSQGSPEDEYYSDVSRKRLKYGYSVGFNFLAGKSPFCKHIIGINYLNSTGEFNYNHSRGSYSAGTQTSYGYHKEANYKSTVHYINLFTGVRFIIYKRLCIDNIFALNIPVRAVNKVNGYETTSERSYSNSSKETHYYNNEITHDSKVNVTVSFAPKISYEFNAGKQKLGVYCSYNFSYKYNLPWYMAGITYYPFKKLR